MSQVQMQFNFSKFFSAGVVWLFSLVHIFPSHLGASVWRQPWGPGLHFSMK
jgi:hypothetical protein